MSNQQEPLQHKQNNELLVFLAKHLIFGLLAGEITLAALLFLDIGGLRSLIWQSDSRNIALFMLILFFALTFGSLGMGSGVISLVGKGGRDQDMNPDE